MLPGLKDALGELFVLSTPPDAGATYFGGIARSAEGQVYISQTDPLFFANGFGVTAIGQLCVAFGGTIQNYLEGIPRSPTGRVVAYPLGTVPDNTSAFLGKLRIGAAGVYMNNADPNPFATSKFFIDLSHSALVVRGSGVPAFVRASPATQTDFEGKLNQAVSGEIRFNGARRVRNLAKNSGTITAGGGWTLTNCTSVVGATDPDGGATAYTLTATSASATIYRFGETVPEASGLHSWWARISATSNGGAGTLAGTVKLSRVDGSGFAGGNITSSISSAWKRFSSDISTTHPAGPFVGVELSASGDIIEIWHPHAEVVVGQTNQNPSEYVSVGVLSAPFHGAGVDGVKCFNTLNGNTVASNVVTEAAGAAIKSSEAACAGGVTAGVVDATGPVGYLAEAARTNLVLNSAVGVTQTTPTLTAAAHTLSFKGTGSVTCTGGFVGTLVGTGANNRVTLTVTATAAPATLTVTGSVTEMQLEAGAFASSYIPTTTVAVQRNGDLLTYASAGNLSSTVASVYAEVTANSTVQNRWFIGDAGAAWYQTSGNITLFDGTANRAGNALTLTSVPKKIAAKWSGSASMTTIAGVNSASLGFDGNMGFAANFGVGSSVTAGQLDGSLRNAHIWTTALTDAQFVEITTP